MQLDLKINNSSMTQDILSGGKQGIKTQKGLNIINKACNFFSIQKKHKERSDPSERLYGQYHNHALHLFLQTVLQSLTRVEFHEA
jgi:hypothetical protein